MRARPLFLSSLLVAALATGLGAQSNAPRGGLASITPAELKDWLGYVASDQLEGRQIFTEGLGLAGSYIADHLKEWGVQPAGDHGTYFQSVKVLGVKTTSNASVTVEVNGQKRTFKDGEGIVFPRNMGGKQTINGDQIQFVGYGLQVPSANMDDYTGLDAKGKVIVWLGSQGPKTLGPESRRLLGARSRNGVDKGAVTVIGPAGGGFGGGRGGAVPLPAAPAGAAPGAAPAVAGQPPPGAQPPAGGRGGGFGAAQPDSGDFTTVQRYDLPIAPALTAQDEFFEFLFSGSDVKYADLKDKAGKQEPLPAFALTDVKLTVNVDADYSVVRMRLSRNVVGKISGTDPRLKDTYVAFGSHYDHTGFREGAPRAGRGGQPPPDPNDRINNGADDDGSGTVAMMAVAKAFAQGPKPKRSLLFVWHTGEESGLYGSRYMADFPVVPIDRIVAQLNMDMVGRNRDNKESEANTVYLIGSDRISTELHNIDEDANLALAKPLKLDYEFNDPADPESLYTRSDHYSYALKGIPVIFFTTGLHPDYHQVSDSPDKIEYDKMSRIAQLAYATGQRVANLDHAPARDNMGPRAGKNKGGKIGS